MVREIRTKCPDCDLCFVEMYLRADLPRARRSGTLAWVDSGGAAAAGVYHDTTIKIHLDVSI